MKHRCLRRPRLSASLLSLPLISLGACSGGQTGDLSLDDPESTDEPGDTGDASLARACEETSTVIDDSEAMTDLGFAPAEILTFASQTFSTSLRWAESDAQIAYFPSGITELTLTVSYGAGEIRYVASDFATGGGSDIIDTGEGPAGSAVSGTAATDEVTQIASAIAAPLPSQGGAEPLPDVAEEPPANDAAVDGIGAGPCRDRLEIDVTVSLSTADGGFNETFETTLRVPAANIAAFSHALDLQALTGSFSALVRPTDGGEAELVQPSLSVGLAPFGSYGILSGFLQTTIPGPVGNPELGAVGIGPLSALASWPSDAQCAADPNNPFTLGLAVTADEDLGGFTAADVMQVVQGTGPQPLVWDDGSQTTLSLGAQATGNACVQFDESGLNLFQPIVLSAITADGRLDGVYETSMAAGSGATGELGIVAVTVDRFDLAPGDAASTGLTAASLEGFDFGSYTFALTYSEPSAPPTGFVQLSGFINPMCSNEVIVGPDGSMGTAGCPGADVQTLVNGVIGE